MLTTLDLATKNLEKHMGHLGRVFEKAHWNFSDTFLWANLNWAYNRENYYFAWADNMDCDSLYKYIHGAALCDSKNQSAILIYLNRNSNKFFRRFAKPEKRWLFYEVQRNHFFRELFIVLCHEHLHEFQLINVNHVVSTADLIGADYYLDKFEQSAFAQQAAIELIHTGYSSIVASYICVFGEHSKEFKKWYSRVVRFLRAFPPGAVEFLADID